MSPEIAVALIVAVIAPGVMSTLTAHQARVSKREDYARQDLVAERAEAVARQAAAAAQLLAERQKITAARAEAVAATLLDSNRAVANTARRSADETNGQLKVIHALVNSQLTAAMQSELDATVDRLVWMREVISLKQANGQEPNEATLATIATAEAKIEALQDQIAERHRQDEIANAQLVKIVAMDQAPDPGGEAG